MGEVGGNAPETSAMMFFHCLSRAPRLENIKGFRIILKQAVMGRYVMNDSYAFSTLAALETCSICRASNGRH